MHVDCVSRRRILQAATAVPAALAVRALFAAAPSPQSFRAAVIGHTGKGDYGHGMDVVFKGVPGAEVVALADAGADDDARAKIAGRVGAARHYGDYREMLAKEKPQLVSVAPRWTDEHHAMALAALAAGAHLITEKPF